jgi:prepilin-type N-terminal cleavage/methylation domain-containing protein
MRLRPNRVGLGSSFGLNSGALPRAFTRHHGAFTLIEMIVVIGIIALIAALALPHIRGNTEAVALDAAAHQFVEDLSLARQKAMAQRSTVAVVFLTDVLFNNAQVNPALANADEKTEIKRLQAGIYTHYALYSFRRLGEQPGQASMNYLTEWKSLPEKTFFPTNNEYSVLNLASASFPFPNAASKNLPVLPYIAFDADGKLIQIQSQVTGRGTISSSVTNSIARGAVFYARDAQGAVSTVEFQETPPGNGLNTLIVVDAVTGRGKREEPQLP